MVDFGKREDQVLSQSMLFLNTGASIVPSRCLKSKNFPSDVWVHAPCHDGTGQQLVE